MITQKILKREDFNRSFFRRMVLTVCFFIAVYSGIYYFLNARLACLLLLLGVLVFTPLILIFEKKYPNPARLMFILSSHFYIFVPTLAIQIPMNIECYYLVAVMLSGFLFRPDQKAWVISGMALSPIFWCYHTWG
jgi:hypothetical protein